MFTHEFNVYEILSKLDGLLNASNHDDPSPLDRAEYQMYTNKLVQGAVELLHHLALHDVLVYETAEGLETIDTDAISALAIDDDEASTDEVVGLALPAHLVPYGAILEAMKTWNVGTVETTADLAVLAHGWMGYRSAEGPLQGALLAAWADRASATAPRLLPAVERLVAAGVLTVHDARTGSVMRPQAATMADDMTAVVLHVESEPERRSARRPGPAAVRKRKRT